MFGREKLEEIQMIGWECYDKEEADKVMDAMERRIARLTALVEGLKRNSVELGEMYKRRLAVEQARINELESQLPKWISVKDRPPYSMQRVLVCTTRGTFAPATYSPLTNSWIEHGQLLGKITHWMPLPPPPTTEESSATKKEK